MTDTMKIGPPLDQLGLPPMELAESSNERGSRFMNSCVYPILQKTFVLLFILTFCAGAYVLLLKVLESSDNSSQGTEIIILTGSKDSPNITFLSNDLQIFFKLANITSKARSRRKRDAGHIRPINLWNERDLQKAKEIILQHQTLCHEKENEEVCKKLFIKLMSIIGRNEIIEEVPNSDGFTKGTKRNVGVHSMDAIDSANVEKRDDISLARIRAALSRIPEPVSLEVNTKHVHPLTHVGVPPIITDNCTLAKRSYPHGMFESSSSELNEPHVTHHSFNQHSHSRYNQPSMHSYNMHGRESHKHKLHPQDAAIIINFFTPKPDKPEKQQEANITARANCAPGALPCDNSEDCVDEKQWCDGNVDCSDSSDEVRCSCKSRVDESRLCDGYFDCPFGEDEMGCFGCSEGAFSCKDINQQSQSTCYTKEQRCNNEIDCPNRKDEMECNMLAPSLSKNPLFAVSNIQGYLHRNLKGDWYAVCQNPYMWAHDVCRRETGLMIRPPFIEYMPVDPMLRVNYLNAGPADSIQSSDTCFNSSAAYITCPDIICGTRVSAQLLKDNTDAENHLFGRNKRFLYPRFPGYLYSPYRMMYYRNRMKRDTRVIDKMPRDDIDSDKIDSKTDSRNKRAESRVVGGKPSQPADWPWMVAIYRNGMFHCGGVIFSQSWVISAAHCVAMFWDHYYEVQVGMLRRFSFSPQEQNHRVTHIIVNQHYNQIDMKDDLSLLRVEPAMQFSRWVRPICLPGPHTAGSDWRWGPEPGTMCTAVGWGATVEHGPDPDHLREVEVPIWKNCKHREDKAGQGICAGLIEGGKDACQGDSGGPLLCRNHLNSQQWYLAGIVSHGDGCARENEPGVYTRVSVFVKWIKYQTSSKTLPLVKPIQECPGFKCKSGILKCLPLIRKCDKIVDCLNAEDETNCVFTNLRSVSKIFNNISKTNENKSPEKRESVLSSTSLTGDPDFQLLSTTTETINTNTFSTLPEFSITSNDESDNKPTESIVEMKTPNFALASTIEISPSISVESSGASTESVTEDITTNDVTFDKNNDLDNVTVTFVPEKLKPRSSVIEKSGHELENYRRTDIIQEDDNFIFTTTLDDMIDSESQSKFFTDKVNVPKSLPADPLEVQNSVDSTVSKTNKDRDKVHSFFSIDKIHDSVENNISKVNMDVEDVTKSLSVDKDQESVDNISKDDTDKIENKSGELIVNLLFNTDTTSQTNFIARENKTQAQEASKTGSNGVPEKNLPDRESKTNLLDKLEDFDLSELQPAGIRRKHLVPKEFECKSQRCDHKADCEDGTDELGCTCLDYLSTYDQNLLCDGVFDCSDGQDEMNCYSCPDQHFLCKRSEICLPMKYVCDGKPQCPLGEDELNCFTLSNGKEMVYDIDDKPIINLEGYMTRRNKDDWQVVCEDNLTAEQLEESSTHICHYLGFSSANRYTIKYINVKEEDLVTTRVDDKRSRRYSNDQNRIQFAYRNVIEKDSTARNVIIKDPQLLKEECVPNITKTCKSLYVYCDRTLYTNFDMSQNMIYNRAAEAPFDITTHMWPWIAKVYVDGHYKCTGVLVDESWVLISNACLWDSLPMKNCVSVLVGSHRTLNTVGFFEKSHKVDAKKELYRSKAVLLHLKEPVKYSNNVKPMAITSPIFQTNPTTTCVAVGEGLNNETISVFLNETKDNCKPTNRCFVRQGTENICRNGLHSGREWAGIISCHNEQGWYPAATFVDNRGECNLGQTIVATEVEHLKYELRHNLGKPVLSESLEQIDNDHCEGVRCSRGRCVHLKEVCDGVIHCEDGRDEFEDSCIIKKDICDKDLYHTGCECSLAQMKCKNGKCIPKELFGDGMDDCGDGTDEPKQSSCSDYIARVLPSKLCDGKVHCLDRSDEDPLFCKCFAKQTFKCGSTSGNEDYCVAPDVVCDGVRDCPNGADERNCIGLSAPKDTPYGMGQVIIQSHGVWRSKCYTTQNHTKSELEAICRELGFLSGHAKEIKEIKNTFMKIPNNLVLELFREVILNNKTVIRMRNSNEPMARAIFDNNLKNCHPVFIECI